MCDERDGRAGRARLVVDWERLVVRELVVPVARLMVVGVVALVALLAVAVFDAAMAPVRPPRVSAAPKPTT